MCLFVKNLSLYFEFLTIDVLCEWNCHRKRSSKIICLIRTVSVSIHFCLTITIVSRIGVYMWGVLFDYLINQSLYYRTSSKVNFSHVTTASNMNRSLLARKVIGSCWNFSENFNQQWLPWFIFVIRPFFLNQNCTEYILCNLKFI